MEKYICTNCGTLTDRVTCPECNHVTVINIPRNGKAEPIRVDIPAAPYNIPYRPLTNEEIDIIERVVMAAPYYILRYGDAALGYIMGMISQKDNPYIYWLIFGLRKGLVYVNGKLQVR